MGLIGQDISYTRSPALHNSSAALLGINAAYLPIDIARHNLSDFLSIAWQIGAMGFNVTTPHKSLVAELLGLPPEYSVNTLRRSAEGWEATSTDGRGFVLGLERMGCRLADFDGYVFLGNGGAVSAIVRELDQKPIRILRRDHTRDAYFGDERISFADFCPEELAKAWEDIGSRCLLIQATNAPHKGVELSEFSPALATFTGAVSDLVYAKPSALVEQAKAQGLPAQDGGAMLIEQARLSQQFWWGISVTFDQMADFLQSS